MRNLFNFIDLSLIELFKIEQFDHLIVCIFKMGLQIIYI